MTAQNDVRTHTTEKARDCKQNNVRLREGFPKLRPVPTPLLVVGVEAIVMERAHNQLLLVFPQEQRSHRRVREKEERDETKQDCEESLLCKRMRRQPSTISNWIKHRGLPFVQLGHRSFYIPSDQLDAWIAAQVQIKPMQPVKDSEAVKSA